MHLLDRRLYLYLLRLFLLKVSHILIRDILSYLDSLSLLLQNLPAYFS